MTISPPSPHLEYVTETGYPEPDRGPLQVLHSKALPAGPLPGEAAA